jgi:maleamate amidohydrolase
MISTKSWASAAPWEIQGRLDLPIVDFVNGFADPVVFGGGNIPAARAKEVLAAGRRSRWPVAHSRIIYADDGADANVFSVEVPGVLTLTERATASEIVPELAPIRGELVVRKTAPSAFLGDGSGAQAHVPGSRNFADRRLYQRLRASVVDAICHGFRPVAMESCVGDSAITPHQACLISLRNMVTLFSRRLFWLCKPFRW